MTGPAWRGPTPCAPTVPKPKKLNPGAMHELECGCKVGANGPLLLYVPCSKSCVNYQYLLSVTGENTPVIKIGDEDDLPD